MTTLFGTVESAEVPLIETVARKKHGWLPILTVLFLISYGLMTMLIVEQGQTIDSQRALIRELFGDSRELSAMKLKAHENQASHNSATHAPAGRIPSAQIRSNQIPSTQAPAKQAPSSQAGSQVRTHDRNTHQKPFRMPSRPESEPVDSSRALVTI